LPEYIINIKLLIEKGES